VLIHKLEKPPDVPSFNHPISLLPSFSKILEKILLKRIYLIIMAKNIIPNIQFSVGNNHSALHETHRIVDNIVSRLENKQYCTTVFST